MIIDDTDD